MYLTPSFDFALKAKRRGKMLSEKGRFGPFSVQIKPT